MLQNFICLWISKSNYLFFRAMNLNGAVLKRESHAAWILASSISSSFISVMLSKPNACMNATLWNWLISRDSFTGIALISLILSFNSSSYFWFDKSRSWYLLAEMAPTGGFVDLSGLLALNPDSGSWMLQIVGWLDLLASGKWLTLLMFSFSSAAMPALAAS